MGYLLKADIPLSCFLCHTCKTKETIGHRAHGGSAYIRYDVPVDIDNQVLLVSVDVKKITWQRINPITYSAYSEMYVDCPLCSLRHSILPKVQAPKIFLENSIICDVCHNKLNLMEEHISLEEENGREKLTIKGALVCQFCGKHLFVEQCQEPNELLKEDIALLQIQSVNYDLRRVIPMRFKIGVTFTGAHRSRVKSIMEALLTFGFNRDDIFFDEWHEDIINGIDADIELGKIYENHCDCIVVFLSKDYNTKSWTRGVEWRAIRRIINNIQGKMICLINIDGVDIDNIDGLSGDTDIAKKIEGLSDSEVAKFIKKRYDVMNNLSKSIHNGFDNQSPVKN